MRADRGKVFALRKRGWSYNLIHKKLGVPISTLSNWLSEISWSKTIRKDLTQKAFIKVYPQLQAMNQTRMLKWEKWREEARQEAKRDFGSLSQDQLFIAGVVIYWGEGDKNPKNPVRVSNTDPHMLKIFVKFLRAICALSEDKVKAHLVLYPDLDEPTCKKYWSSLIGIRQTLFYKTQVIQGKHKTRRLGYGICTVEVSSRQLKEKMLVWIKNMPQIV
jgi:hypothetical protein